MSKQLSLCLYLSTFHSNSPIFFGQGWVHKRMYKRLLKHRPSEPTRVAGAICSWCWMSHSLGHWRQVHLIHYRTQKFHHLLLHQFHNGMEVCVDVHLTLHWFSLFLVGIYEQVPAAEILCETILVVDPQVLLSE